MTSNGVHGRARAGKGDCVGRWLLEAMVVWAWMAQSRSCAVSSAAAGIERGGEDWGKFP
jgi:hypothetical protein